MEPRTDRIGLPALRLLAPATLAVLASIRFLDEPIAVAVGRMLRSNAVLDEYAAGLPDVLLPAVVLLTAGAWAGRFLRLRRGLRDARADFYRLSGTVLPLCFLAKTALKALFGRIETRVWYRDPDASGLLWFTPGEGHAGFPSGHMAVFAGLAAACWIFLPALRGACLSLLVLLGAALILTNYHFLSDVIAGAYLGLAVTAATHALLERHAA